MVAQKIEFPMEEIMALCRRNKVRELALELPAQSPLSKKRKSRPSQ